MAYIGYVKNWHVFLEKGEKEFVKAFNIYFDLNPKNLGKLAYKVEEANKLKIPQNTIALFNRRHLKFSTVRNS